MESNQNMSTLWKSNIVKTPGPRTSLRPPSSSTAIYVAIFQGAQLNYTAIKLALELHAHSVQYAYQLVSTRCAFEKTSFNSQTWATASNPPDPYCLLFLLLVKGIHSASALGILFSSIDVGSVFIACVVFLFFLAA
eukprot:1145932-Pelagomonas_calceolata.AAC.2